MLLYHYTKYENYKKIILKDKLSFRLTEFRDLKDPNEGLQYLSVNKIMKNNDRKSNLGIYILSLCKFNNSNYMWHNYGDNGKGIILGLDTSIIRNGVLHRLEECDYSYKTVSQVYNNLYEVKEKYKSEELVSAIQEKVSRFGANFEEMKYALEQYAVMNVSQPLLRVKAPGYYKEYEARYIVTPSDIENFVECPNQKYVYMYPVKKGALKEMYIGPNCDNVSERIKEIKKHLDSLDYIGIPVKQINTLLAD